MAHLTGCYPAPRVHPGCQPFSRVLPAPFAARRALSTGSRPRRVLLTAELKVGEKLSDYPDYYRVLPASDGSSVALSKFLDKSPVVLFFYPKAGTPGCTKQACSFRDSYAVFQDAGATVLGISTDSPEANAKFGKEQRLPFPLLTDQGGFLRKSFGIKADLFGALAGRQTFVIDKSGVCRLSFNNQFQPEKHYQEALEVINTL